MMKKMLAMLLALVMLLSMAACAQDSKPAEEKPNAPKQDVSAAPQENSQDAQQPETEQGKDFGGAELVVATWGWAEAGLKKLETQEQN